MVDKKQIFFDHEDDKQNTVVKDEKRANSYAVWGLLEFGSEFHVPYGYPLTKEAVEELNESIKKEEEALKQ